MKLFQSKFQTGQTLIETMVAVFIMVMGITAALGLANYSLNASTGISKQIIGMGLAREGMEAVKNMRDTNWLNGTLSTDCASFIPEFPNSNCRRDWLNLAGGYPISSSPQSYRLAFNGASSSTFGYWSLTSSLGNVWALDKSVNPNTGFYVTNPTPGAIPNSGFYRKITITPDSSAAPFNNADWPRLLVQTQVWWTDKGCPASPTWPTSGKCSIQLQTYLTNWKTY